MNQSLEAVTWRQMGVIGKPYGLAGDFFVNELPHLFPTDISQVSIGAVGTTAVTTEILVNRVVRQRSVLRVALFRDRTALDRAYGLGIWIATAGEEPVLLPSMIGCAVVDGEMTSVGMVRDQYNYGASDVLCIDAADGVTYEVPYVAGYFHVLPPDGGDGPQPKHELSSSPARSVAGISVVTNSLLQLTVPRDVFAEFRV